MKISKFNILFHVIGCISFFLLPLVFFPTHTNKFDVFNDTPLQRDFVSQLLLIAFFYLNYFLLIPKLYFAKKYFIFYTIIVLCLAVIVLLPSLLTRHMPFGINKPKYRLAPASLKPPPNIFDANRQPPPHDNAPFFGELNHTIFLYFVVYFFSLSLKINHRLSKVQQEKTDAELLYLKSQINPHFLFNTLNLIYSLAIKKSEQTSEAVVKLANMMRYVLYESNKNFVPLQNEIAYIENYIELQQTRFGSSIKLLFDISGEAMLGKKIAPLILIPFVENGFKHGVNAEENSDIKIQIQVNKEDVILTVFNTKVSIAPLNKNEGGVGIANTKNRLELLYANNYELKIDDNEKDFSVYLKLHLYD